ncbi:MAG: aminopeptidase P family protein [Candidatus Schekmanbacteria bacterium]|nr:aminopeptidase P family protein [Candidatus Schekmanbacteria bacterium]
MDNEKDIINDPLSDVCCLRLTNLQSSLPRHRIDALLVSSHKNIRWLTGFTGSSGLLLVDRRKSYLFTDGRYIVQAKQEVSGTEIVITHKPAAFIAKALKTGAIKRLGLEEQNLTLAAYRQLETALNQSATKLVPIRQGIVENQRRIKDDSELERIGRAIEITGKAFSAISAEIKPGIKERELALLLEWAMRKLGAEAVSFETIVASGQRSALPHGRASDKVIESGDLVVIDFGASVDGYCADVTRTLMVGEPSAEQKKIYNLISRVQKLGIETARPGILVSQIDLAIRQEIKDAGYGNYFVHSSGHGLGLDVHEGPRIYKTDKTVLQPGMVFTIEPGVYLPGLGGVRIEDMLVVTQDGCQVLTGGIPKYEFI